MKSKFYSIRLLAMVFLTSAISTVATAQDVYFREGFESGTGWPSAVPAVPTPVTSTVSGEWIAFLVNRTNGATGSCTAANGSADHGRMYNFNNYLGTNPALTDADSGYLVTPVVNFGIAALHFQRGRIGRRFSIYYTTVANPSAADWILSAQSNTATNATQSCVDTTWNINQPNAKRLKIVGRSGTDSDIDSVWMTSTSVFPVKFNGIAAVLAGKNVKVSWGIATEINTLKYAVERSTNGVTFTSIGEVAAVNKNSYSYIDANPTGAITYYRIKGIDKDGKSMTSTIVKIATGKNAIEFVVAPNIIDGRTLNLRLTTFEKGNFGINVINNLGQVVYRTSVSNDGGLAFKSLNLPTSLTAGTYRVQLVTGATSITKSIVLQ